MLTKRIPTLLACTGLILAGCTDAVTDPDRAPLPDPEIAVPGSLAAEPTGELFGTLKLHGSGNQATRTFAVVRSQLREVPASPDLQQLQTDLHTLGARNAHQARIARAFAFGSQQDRRAAAATLLAGVTLHTAAPGANGLATRGSIRRGNRDWITWSLDGGMAPTPGADRAADGLGVANPSRPESSARPLRGLSGQERVAAAGDCFDCEGYEDYDPYYDPQPVVTEMAAATAFLTDLEALSYAGGMPEECYGYRTAFHVSLSTTFSAAAVATLAAYARMPTTAYNYYKLAGQGVFATYVAWEFLESCKAQFKKTSR